ncbi:unnamed protein product [Trichobilharzia regenti]|nr:unnamed protein product [Trichobilharzia regenti]
MICAFYACLLIGAIPVPVRPPRIDSCPPNSSGGTSGSGPIGLLSGPPGSGSTPGLSLLGLGGGSPGGGGGGFNGHSAVGGSAGQLSTGTTGSFPNVYFRPNAPSLDTSLDLVWNVVKHSGASVIFTQTSLFKLLKSKVSRMGVVSYCFPVFTRIFECCLVLFSKFLLLFWGGIIVLISLFW